MSSYCSSHTQYSRLPTREVKIGDLLMGNFHPIRIQTMTTTDTLDTIGTVEQCIRCIRAGSELVRITAPSKNEAQNLLEIKKELGRRGYHTPLVADIHFTPNAAEIAARIVEKVRVNPGNYADKKKFEHIEYSEADYREEIQRIRDRFTPLIRICKEYGTAMRIGTNHGSLSDRIMSRYGDTPMGMVESALEFLRIARDENYHQVVLSMKSSNPLVMVQAYRLLIRSMQEEFGEVYPLHLGVTEAGDGEDGRIKSAVGIGTLLEDGIGDTIRVSLTEDPEFEIPVCRDLVNRYGQATAVENKTASNEYNLPYSPYEYSRRESFPVGNIGGKNVPVVIADLSKIGKITPGDLSSVGYNYDAQSDKWAIGDRAADYIFTGDQVPDFGLPTTLNVIVFPEAYEMIKNSGKEFSQACYPIFSCTGYEKAVVRNEHLNFVMIDCDGNPASVDPLPVHLGSDPTVVFCLSSEQVNAMQCVRQKFVELLNNNMRNPVILVTDSNKQTPDEHMIHFSTETGALLLEGMGDGISLGYGSRAKWGTVETGSNVYTGNSDIVKVTNSVAFGVLQATRTRISKTEYISCPSCGRTLFDLQETTAKIRAVTNHLKGVKIAIMGCIVNGPGEMADADFGYVGSGPGKITLYKGKEVMKKNISSEIAVEELIKLIKEQGTWIETGTAYEK